MSALENVHPQRWLGGASAALVPGQKGAAERSCAARPARGLGGMAVTGENARERSSAADADVFENYVRVVNMQEEGAAEAFTDSLKKVGFRPMACVLPFGEASH